MDKIKPNQGNENQRRVYNTLKSHPQLAEDLAKILDKAYNDLLDKLYARLDQEAIKEGLPLQGDTDFNLIADFLTVNMEEYMAWPNLISTGNQPYEDWGNDEKESFIREISAIEKGYWDGDPETGELCKYDCFGNKQSK